MPPRLRIYVVLIVSLTFLWFVFSNLYQIKNVFSYASRPLWDKPDGPQTLLAHYHAEGLPLDANTCALHGWSLRDSTPPVWDAVLFNTELDLLEIRWNELNSVVDKFFILESNRTFTGLPKPALFSENRARFAKFEKKIVYHLLPGQEPGSEGPFGVEGAHRRAMSDMLLGALSTNRGNRPLVIYADVDEIPSAHTLRLLQRCSAPTPLHLRMNTYLYSFEWPYGANSWRAQVHDWGRGASGYTHAMQTDVALADSGWHCTYCFRYLDEFVTKMQGFSHADRIGGAQSLLGPARIQDVICNGKDIFNMFPEAYTYKDMLALMNLEPSRTAVGLPLYLLQNASRFKFLLPGGCKREH